MKLVLDHPLSRLDCILYDTNDSLLHFALRVYPEVELLTSLIIAASKRGIDIVHYPNRNHKTPLDLARATVETSPNDQEKNKIYALLASSNRGNIPQPTSKSYFELLKYYCNIV